MRTKEEILKQMEDEMPFEMIGSGQIPYILEAMEVYAHEVVKNNAVLPFYRKRAFTFADFAHYVGYFATGWMIMDIILSVFF